MKTSIIFLIGALLAYMGVLLDSVLAFIGRSLSGISNFQDWGLIPILGHWVIISILWGLFAYMLYRISKKQGFDIFENKAKPSTKNVLIVLVLIVIMVIKSYLIWYFRFKPVAEFTSHVNIYGNSGVFTFIFQYVYYFFECTLVFLIIAFGQKFGETTFQVKNTELIPWGGFVCCLTWGLGHIFSQDLASGLLSAIMSLFFGLAYLLLQKNTIYAYIAITLMFIL